MKKAEDYLWSSAKAHVLGVKNDVLSGECWLEGVDISAYRESLRNEDKEIEESIRKATSTGRPFGAEMFIKRFEKILGRNLLPKKAGRPKNEK